ncbi:MAG: oxidative damage protection protein [Ostreibacterium sp.]
MVYCHKLQKVGEPLERPPLPGEIGKEILSNISKEAWQQWLAQQTILINEYHLNPMDSQARKFLEEQMLAFLFDKKSD